MPRAPRGRSRRHRGTARSTSSLDQIELRVDDQREPPPPGRFDQHVRRFLAEPRAQEDQAALEVVLNLRQSQRAIEAQLAIRERRAPGTLPLAEQLPEDARGNIADQILAVEEDGVVVFVV